jgi:hypothetical protein
MAIALHRPGSAIPGDNQLELPGRKQNMKDMNGTAPKIEIIAPFQAAFEWMKTMLFRPFDVAKWLTIAFAAFLAGRTGGLNFNYRSGNWNYRATRHGDFATDWNFAPWLIALIVVIVLFVIAIAIVWAWVSARGRFIFTDCIVKNRAALAEPWREFRREGNSFFVFWLVIGLGALFATAMLGVIGFVIFRISGGSDSGFPVVLVIVLIVLGLVWLSLAIVLSVVSHFMVPVMYRRRCGAKEAFLDVGKLILAHPGPFILFILFGIALVIGVAIIGTMLACFTCCIGGLPYISTVLLLPAIVWLAAYKLLFIRQFGDAYDVWAGVVAPPPSEPLPPPLAPAV